jgi:hypothetical protein
LAFYKIGFGFGFGSELGIIFITNLIIKIRISIFYLPYARDQRADLPPLAPPAPLLANW